MSGCPPSRSWFNNDAHFRMAEDEYYRQQQEEYQQQQRQQQEEYQRQQDEDRRRREAEQEVWQSDNAYTSPNSYQPTHNLPSSSYQGSSSGGGCVKLVIGAIAVVLLGGTFSSFMQSPQRPASGSSQTRKEMPFSGKVESFTKTSLIETKEPVETQTQPPIASPSLESSTPVNVREYLQSSKAEALRDRLSKLSIDPSFFSSLFEEGLHAKNPRLSNGKLEDGTQLQAELNRTANNLLYKLETLSPQTRQKLGTYRRVNYDQWLEQLGETRTSSSALDKLADDCFFQLFPDLKGQTVNPHTYGQVWYAIAEEQISRVKTQKPVTTQPSPVIPPSPNDKLGKVSSPSEQPIPKLPLTDDPRNINPPLINPPL